MDVRQLLTEALKRESFGLQVDLSTEPNCHKLDVYAIDEKEYGSAAANCRISLHPPMLLSNADVFPDNDYTADEMDAAKVERVKTTAVLAALGRIVRSDFFKLVAVKPTELSAGGSSPWKEWKLYLATAQGPVASSSWRYDTLCDPRFKEKEKEEEVEGKKAGQKESSTSKESTPAETTS